MRSVKGYRGTVRSDTGRDRGRPPTLAAGNPPLRDIREPDSPRGFGFVWALLGAAVAAGIAWLATRLLDGGAAGRRPSPRAAPAPPPQPPDPYDAALARLEEIEREGWVARGDVARHYEPVADVLRDYLEAAEGVPARERTTTELLWSLPPGLAEGGLRRRCRRSSTRPTW